MNNEKATETDVIVDKAIKGIVEKRQGIETTLIIRTDEALKVHEETAVDLAGILDTPARWLEKRQTKHDSLSAHIIVDREKMSIQLITEERDYFKNKVKGSLEFHPIFLKFGINSDKYISSFEMADLIKMNRYYFESKSDAMQLVSTLKNFKAKVDSDIEKANDNKGNVKAILQQTVTSNMPDSFKMKLPIFKGQKAITIEVEVYIRADDFACTLISPEANEETETLRDIAINEQIDNIKKLTPEIVIIEK